MRRALLPLLLALLLAGCAAREDRMLVSVHLGHDFEGAPRDHGLEIGADADVLIAHLEIAPRGPDAACAAGASIVLLGPDGAEAARVDSSAEGCPPIREARVTAAEGPWLVGFRGQGPMIGGADVRAIDVASGGARLGK